MNPLALIFPAPAAPVPLQFPGAPRAIALSFPAAAPAIPLVLPITLVPAIQRGFSDRFSARFKHVTR